MEPFLGQIALFAFNYAPADWSTCDGRSLRIAEYTPLFSLIGTYYGGDGRTQFNLPNLQGLVLYGASGNTIGTRQGSPTVQIDATTMATHNHALIATTQTGNAASAPGDVFAATGATIKNGPTKIVLKRYSTNNATTALAGGSIGATGQGQAHNNMQPYLVLNYCIALKGIYPDRP